MSLLYKDRHTVKKLTLWIGPSIPDGCYIGFTMIISSQPGAHPSQSIATLIPSQGKATMFRASQTETKSESSFTEPLRSLTHLQVVILESWCFLSGYMVNTCLSHILHHHFNMTYKNIRLMTGPPQVPLLVFSLIGKPIQGEVDTDPVPVMKQEQFSF